MADLAGEEIALDPPLIDGGAIAFDGELIDPLGGVHFIYLMRAADSVTGAVYSWTSPTRAFDGSGYPGPNAPLRVEVAGKRVVQ